MASRLFDDLQWEAGRTEDVLFDLYDLNDNPLQIAAGDIVHFTLGIARGSTALLTLHSDQAATDDSRVEVLSLGTSTTPARVKVRVAGAASAAFAPAYPVRYYAALDLEDASESDPLHARKPICRGSIVYNPNVPL